MKQGQPPTPEGAEILQAGGRGGTGNVLYLFRHTQPPAILKVYRTRRSRLNEFLKDFSERILEGKRGATAFTRYATEKTMIDLWTSHGFDVVRRIDRPLPAGIAMPALWLKFCAGRVLWDVLSDAREPLAGKLVSVESLGASLSRRHTRAIELQEPLLVHENGHIKHFFLHDGRLIAFDLEHAFAPDYPVIKAVAREIASAACSLTRADTAAAETSLGAFVSGYANLPVLKQAVTAWKKGGGIAGNFRPGRKGRRDSRFDKTSVMQRLGQLLDWKGGL